MPVHISCTDHEYGSSNLETLQVYGRTKQILLSEAEKVTFVNHGCFHILLLGKMIFYLQRDLTSRSQLSDENSDLAHNPASKHKIVTPTSS